MRFDVRALLQRPWSKTLRDRCLGWGIESMWTPEDPEGLRVIGCIIGDGGSEMTVTEFAQYLGLSAPEGSEEHHRLARAIPFLIRSWATPRTDTGSSGSGSPAA